MGNHILANKSLHLSVTSESLDRFTTLLQSGISLTTTKGTPLGVFLSRLPGFTEEYIADRLQTIFLDGNAVDDLQTPLIHSGTVLAVSAAMPGLAGAIFRKNSLHAALRTKSADSTQVKQEASNINVSLKMFNVIARERGAELFQGGVSISGTIICDFLKDRPSLLSHIHSIMFDDYVIYPDTFLSEINFDELINLKITLIDG